MLRPPPLFLAGASLFAALLVGSVGRAEPGGLAVERGTGAEGCPDSAELGRLVASVRGREESRPLDYRVRFERSANTYRASIVGAEDRSERTLTDDGATCAALGRAAAVTLALLLDPGSEPQREPDSAPVTKTPRPPPSEGDEATASAPREARRRQGVALLLNAGGGLLAGVVRPAAPGLLAGVGLRAPQLEIALNGLWIVPAAVELGPGQVTTSLLAGKLEACAVSGRLGAQRLLLCSGLLAGFARARAEGYTRNDARSRPWLAVPVEVALSGDVAPLSFSAGVTLLMPVRRQDFEVEGVGVAHHSTAIAGLLWLRAVGVVPF